MYVALDLSNFFKKMQQHVHAYKCLDKLDERWKTSMKDYETWMDKLKARKTYS